MRPMDPPKIDSYVTPVTVGTRLLTYVVSMEIRTGGTHVGHFHELDQPGRYRGTCR